MKETLHFRVESAQNFALLYMTVMYEKRPMTRVSEKIAYSVWHERFHRKDGEQLVLELMTKLFPEGGTLDVPELDKLLLASIEFVENDEECKKLTTKYKRRMYDSYVYSKYNDECRYASFAEHTNTVEEMTEEFFGKDLEEFDKKDIREFILKNFELHGSQLSIESIAYDIAKFYGRWDS